MNSSPGHQPLNQLILFVTGRLAEPSLRETVEPLSRMLGFQYEVVVPGIQVAALLHVRLLLRRLSVPPQFDRVILPGWVQGDIEQLSSHFGRPFERGPKDLRDLPEYFGAGTRKKVALDQYSLEIIGEINHATRQPLKAVVAEALGMTARGANVIDVGCIPGESSGEIKAIVSALKNEGLRVSIDSFDRHEITQAVDAGAELILSCNHSNIDWVTSFGTEVVVIPDTPSDMHSLHRLIERLAEGDTPFRIDPIIEPIGMGFTASLQRYMDARRQYPDVPIMMGVGNITELTEVDSAGVNMILAAICEELQIRSVLTTQVINWCRTSIAELDAARRIAHYAVNSRTVPKHIDSSLVMLRDSKLKPRRVDSLNALAASLTDANFRIFAEPSGLHLMNNQGHWQGENPFGLFADAQSGNRDIEVSHAFYLGYEMARAEVCRLLGKQYTQDEPIAWGLAGTLQGSASVGHRTDQEVYRRDISPPQGHFMETNIQQIWKHVEWLASEPRPAETDRLESCRQYCEAELQTSGWAVERRHFSATNTVLRELNGINLVATHQSHQAADRPTFVLGAHLDSCLQTPGADDNASAVAALLEVARVLGQDRSSSELNLELVVFDLEEHGMLGGAFHAAACRQQKTRLVGMVSLEMLGYCSHEPGSQHLPDPLKSLYPDTGNFIGVVGNQNSTDLIKRFTAAFRTVAELPCEALQIPDNGHPFPPTRLSDHSPFWDEGYPALMITDTSFLRNPHYHEDTDTPETLDRDFLHKVTEGVLKAVRSLANIG